MIEWKDLKYFKKDSEDKWGDPSKIDKFLLLYLDEFRDAIGTAIYVTSGYRRGDSGQHGMGKAVDIVAPKYPQSLLDLYLTAERFNFTGIGIYRDWFYNGVKCGGLHLDTRIKLGNYNTGVHMAARWLCIRPGAEKLQDPKEIMKIKQIYLPLTKENLKNEGII